jgi:hypothetical protein
MPSPARDSRVAALSRNIIDEILIAVGLPAHGWHRRLLEPLLWTPAERFSRLAARFDQTLDQSGLCEAARQLLPEFITSWTAHGAENIPQDGPLLVASNHPGAYDGLVIAACLHRSDLKFVISGVPFTQALQNSANAFIFATPDLNERMAVIRTCIRHLQSGGALLIFPSGVVDPDPAIFSDADRSLDRWSRSLEIMLRKVPQARLVPAIVGGVLDPAFFKNPLTRLRKGWEQRKLAEVFQIVQQMVFQKKYALKPRVSFGRALTAEEMAAHCKSGHIIDAVIENARHVLLYDWAIING